MSSSDAKFISDCGIRLDDDALLEIQLAEAGLIREYRPMHGATQVQPSEEKDEPSWLFLLAVAATLLMVYFASNWGSE